MSILGNPPQILNSFEIAIGRMLLHDMSQDIYQNCVTIYGNLNTGRAEGALARCKRKFPAAIRFGGIYRILQVIIYILAFPATFYMGFLIANTSPWLLLPFLAFNPIVAIAVHLAWEQSQLKFENLKFNPTLAPKVHAFRQWADTYYQFEVVPTFHYKKSAPPPNPYATTVARRHETQIQAPTKKPGGLAPREAEVWVAQLMQHLGETDATVTQLSNDGGIDIVSRNCVAQVKHYAPASTVPIASIRELFGVSQAAKKKPLFFASCNYSAKGVEFADANGIALIYYDVTTGAVRFLNQAALDAFPRI